MITYPVRKFYLQMKKTLPKERFLPVMCQQTDGLDVPGDIAMNVNGKAELIMIKFVIPNKSIN